MMQNRPEIVDIAVVGAGPAGLMAAEAAARAGLRVAVFDAMPSAGRKFLMAGRSGLNITNAEDFTTFLDRYGAASTWLRPILEQFSPQDMRDFCAGLGVETFIGSSGRVFPKAMKASPLLRAWLSRLTKLGVGFRPRMRLVDIGADGAIEFIRPDGKIERLQARATVLALGGASWPRLGSTGMWTQALAARGMNIAPFRPSNCGLEIGWSAPFLGRFEGQAFKTARFSHAGRNERGEAVVTKRGLEGGPIYALSAAIGADLRDGREARLSIDLKPDLDIETIAQRLGKRRVGDSLSNMLRKTLGLAPVAVAVLREAARDLPTESETLARLVKSVALPVRAVSGLDRAISSAGGVQLGQVNGDLMLTKLPGVFVAGEMLDWDAPTGGYLLQACFATGNAAGEGATKWAKGCGARPSEWPIAPS